MDDTQSLGSQKQGFEWPQWRKLADSDREYLAGLYETYRSRLIALGQTKALNEFEKRWDMAYGTIGNMEGVISDMQEMNNGTS